MRRLDLVAGHLVETSSVDAAGACTRSDCVIVAGKRSAFGKAGKGAFANTRVEDLVSPVFRALLEKPVHVDDVLMGKVRLLFFFFFFFFWLVLSKEEKGRRRQWCRSSKRSSRHVHCRIGRNDILLDDEQSVRVWPRDDCDDARQDCHQPGQRRNRRRSGVHEPRQTAVGWKGR
jgi:hypothetical protein